MKSISTLLFICLFFSSCHSYRNIDITNQKILPTKKYKITDVTGKSVKTKGCLIINNTLTCEKGQFAISNITEIKLRKFSYFKTIGLAITAKLGILAAIIFNYSVNVDVGAINF